MQVVILCGGKGTRLSEYTEEIPKPLVAIGKKPIIHHLMEMYSSYGHTDFILCLGYKGNKIENYFKNNKASKKWNISFAQTGENSTKAERLIKVRKMIKGKIFLVSYGDDLSDVDINKVVLHHEKSKKTVTLTAVPLVSPFGVIDINKKNEAVKFREKPKLDSWMNGGFYVMDKKIFDFLNPRQELEKDAFENLSAKKQISVYRHNGFWKSMNTLKDVLELNDMHNRGETPWIK
ncbi:MAG: sugar phosphate nucleotidyltransferase [Nanoarchaeota archaeon]